MKKVGIFAGTFDPVHIGHLEFARQALAEARLDKVFFLIEPSPRRKQGVRALEHRERMVQLATADSPDLGSIMLEHARFSVSETLPILKQLYKGAELHLLFGDDILKNLAEWPHVRELVRDVHFVIGVRTTELSAVQEQLDYLQKVRGLTLHYSLFQSAAPEFASSQIRLHIKRGEQAKGLPDKVLAYIQENGLYSPN